jgi:hypothetical protein
MTPADAIIGILAAVAAIAAVLGKPKTAIASAAATAACAVSWNRLRAPDPMTRQSYSIDEIKAMLAERADEVAQRYAPPAAGSYTDKGTYFTLCPWRADRHVGSFVVNLTGPLAGTFHDFATGEHGDMIDLIRLALGCDIREALREARAMLGLQNESPEQTARRKDAAEASRRRRAEAAAEAKAKDEARARQASAVWLSGQARIDGTPVARYLADARAIDLSRLPRPPGAIRYLKDCFYRHIDPETGEVTEARLPAMVAAMSRAGGTVAVHRTYLAIGPDGRWGKADLPEQKKILGPFRGAAIRVWAGIGPRGGHTPLAKAGPDQHVYITEGIEDALTAAMILPHARILAAATLGNIGAVELPANVSRVTIIGDRDAGDQARQALDRGIAAHAAQGREVRLWLAPEASGAKDINDYWRALLAGEQSRKEGAA